MTPPNTFTYIQSIFDWQSNRQASEYWTTDGVLQCLRAHYGKGIMGNRGCNTGQSNEMKVLLALSIRSNVWSVSRLSEARDKSKRLDLNPRRKAALKCPVIWCAVQSVGWQSLAEAQATPPSQRNHWFNVKNKKKDLSQVTTDLKQAEWNFYSHL